MTIKGLGTLATPMRPRVLGKYLGVLCLSLIVMLAVPGAVALAMGDYPFAAHCAVAALVLMGGGLPLSRLTAPRQIQQNEAMAVTALGFIIGALAMAWPFAMAGMEPMNALFESVSAITTTGLSATGGVEAKSPAFMFARSWTQWWGGLAIVTLAFAVVLGPGAASRRLTLSDTGPEDPIGGAWIHGRRVFMLYGGLTIAGGILLWTFGASPFDAAVHALSSLSTGGFSSHDDSVAGIAGAGIPPVMAILCLAGAISFSLQYRVGRAGPLILLRDGSVRALTATIVIFWGLVMFSEWLAGATADATLAANAAFMTISAQTTSGFQTVDPAELAPATKYSLILAMAIGGDVGSTAGGIKILRLLVVLRLVQLTLARTALPRHAVLDQRIGGRRLEPEEINMAVAIVALYILTTLFSWFAFLVAGLEPLDSLFDVVSAIGTVGLSAGIAGPDLATPLKLVLCLDMLLGRLEILAVLVLAYPRNWFGPSRRET